MSEPREFLTKDLVGVMFINGNCVRYDIVINYMAIENYYSKNTNGWEIYKSFQRASCHDPEKYQKKFITLIDSFEKRGNLTKQYPLGVYWGEEEPKRIRDGSHRFASILYFKYDTVFCNIWGCLISRRLCGENRLRRRSFSGIEREILLNKALQILEEWK